MSETKMPAVEANIEANEQGLASYEFSFHVLPTIAEGEVTAVFQKLKDTITKLGGEITTEEAPARFNLAYEIVKYLEGRNRKFSSAYFGWVRFKAEPASIEALNEEVDGVKELLRHLLIKLTKTEEENTFLFHESIEEQIVQTVDLDEEEDADSEEVDESTDSDEESEDGEESEDKV